MEVYDDEPPQSLGLERRAEVHDKEGAGRQQEGGEGEMRRKRGETTRGGGGRRRRDDTRRRRRRKIRHERGEEDGGTHGQVERNDRQVEHVGQRQRAEANNCRSNVTTANSTQPRQYESRMTNPAQRRRVGANDGDSNRPAITRARPWG
jgi:hypothetical protein